MSGLLPLSTYNLAVNPFEPVPAIDDEFPVTIRLTLAAVDPESVDEAKQPSTLRILKKSIFADDESDDESFDEDSEDEEEEEEEEEEEVKKESPKKSPKKDSPKKESPKKKAEEKEESDEDMEDDSEDSDVEDDVEEYVVCTLGPGVQYQQTLDLTITPEEEVYFVATGSYAIHLTGNYVEHPYDGSSSEDEDDYDEEDELDDEDDYDLTPDEDEILSGEEQYGIDDLEDVEDVEGKIEEIIEEEKKTKKTTNKRSKEAEEDVEEKPAKKSKKKVEFSKELEQGPTGSTIVGNKDKKEETKKFPTKTLIGGVTIEDRTTGKGPVCKNGQKVGVRYIGKLQNGKVFDKNTSGKPFVFGLGKGEVIKGWDVGVAGMSVGGERRIVIPAPMAYGKQKLPGIPANSVLTFDVKLVSIK